VNYKNSKITPGHETSSLQDSFDNSVRPIMISTSFAGASVNELMNTSTDAATNLKG